MNKELILATTSIPRKKAFDELQIPYKIIDSEIKEDFEGRPKNPEELVLLLAKLKAESVAKKNNGIVIGFDSVAYFNGQILEKPKTKQEAYERVKDFSGNSYEFFTGIHLIDGDYKESELSITRVKIRELRNNEIIKYFKQDKNFTRYSQGFDPLNTFGSTFIESIEGSYNNILRGIPLEKIVTMIKSRSFEIK